MTQRFLNRQVDIWTPTYTGRNDLKHVPTNSNYWIGKLNRQVEDVRQIPYWTVIYWNFPAEELLLFPF